MNNSRTLLGGFFALLGLSLVLVVGANVWKSSLAVTKIVVAGNRVVDTNEILQLAHVKPGARMYDLDLMVIRKDVVSHHFLKDVVVERDLPSTLRITVIERTPLAMLNNEDMAYLDADGVVLPHSVSQELFDLPLISNVPSGVTLSPGVIVQEHDLIEALDILTTAKLVSKELYHLISEIRLRNGGDLMLYTAEAAVPVIFGHGDAADKLVRLETFWNTIVRERGTLNLQYIDLRYHDQVVVRWNKNTTSTRSL